MPTANVKNRGYRKIEGAARAFNFDFRGKVVLDIGSSTGGFTEYALNHGAQKVIAVEKGTNQMLEPLRSDPRVDLHEKTDIFDVGWMATLAYSAGHEDLARAARSVPEGHARVAIQPPNIIVADVSFLSLTKILKYAKMNIARSDTDYLVMLKPQFEASPDQLSSGIVKNEKYRRQIIKNFEHWLKQNDFIIIKKRDNTIQGKHGNLERFYWLRASS
ncbi:hypothetical protein IJF93_01030 [Candidatus Saccharibacteria bacterium]|nr:hypothetical protein [Candidatus Saccharibacteria bacterium]